MYGFLCAFDVALLQIIHAVVFLQHLETRSGRRQAVLPSDGICNWLRIAWKINDEAFTNTVKGRSWLRDFERIYLTGDTHADFEDLILQSIHDGLTNRDLLIILGDVGINYFGDIRDQMHKDMLAQIPSTILCVRGNHEMRPMDPELNGSYHEIQWMGDQAYIEEAYPRFIMAYDGARYQINGREFLVIGGAYSVDKPFRLQRGYRWFADEQLTKEELAAIRQKVAEHGNREDVILAHTCPYGHRPVEAFLSGLDESNVDHTMEHFLQEITDTAEFNAFYCGHWHIEKQDGKIRFLFHNVIMLDKDPSQPFLSTV